MKQSSQISTSIPTSFSYTAFNPKQPLFPKDQGEKLYSAIDYRRHFIAVNFSLGYVIVSLLAVSNSENNPHTYNEIKKVYWFEAAKVNEVVYRIEKLLKKRPEARVLINTGGHAESCIQCLKEKNINFICIDWDGECFTQSSRKLYVNKRSQAYIDFAKATLQNRFKIRTKEHKAMIQAEIEKIQYVVKGDGRYKVLRDDSVDQCFIDTFAFAFLEGIHARAK
jgi:hypothetical protein